MITPTEKELKIERLLEASGINDEIKDCVEDWLKFLLDMLSSKDFWKAWNLSDKEIEYLKGELLLFQEEYRKNMGSILKILHDKMFAIFESISENNMDKDIAYWESPAGREFSKILAELSGVINTDLMKACGESARETVGKITSKKIESVFKRISAELLENISTTVP